MRVAVFVVIVIVIVIVVVVVVVVGFTSSATFLAGCRNNAPPSVSDDAASGASASTSGQTTDAESVGDNDAHAVRSVEARAEEARRDAGTIPPACDAMALSLVLAALDEQCALPEREWALLLTDAGGAVGGAAIAPPDKRELRQIAKREGEQIVLSLVNTSLVPVVVPLRFHPDHPEKAFSVLAEDDKHAVFELAAPSFDTRVRSAIESLRADGGAPRPGRRSAAVGRPGPDGGSSSASNDTARAFAHVHSARIRLPPGGVARVGLVIDPRVVKRVDRSCVVDAGADCMPLRLPKGHYTLHVGQLIADVDAGLPAHVEWDVL